MTSRMLLAGALAAAWVASASCGGDSEKALAELAAATGQVEGAERGDPEDWGPDEPGATYHRGDGIRTGRESSARVTLKRGGGTLRMGARSLVRFGQSDGLHRIALETGDAEIETGDAELLVATGGGPARLEAGARVLLTREGDRLRLEVVVGNAQIEQTGAPVMAIAAGDDVTLGASGVVARQPEPPDAGVPVADAGTPDAASAGEIARPDDGQPDEHEPRAKGPQLDGRTIEIERSPGAVDLELRAGQNSTLHAPGTPALVRLTTSAQCDGPAVVEVRRGRARHYYRGRGAIGVPLRGGRNRYRIYCDEDGDLEKTGAAGVLRVVRDAGRRKVETRAPTNSVEADGRTYRLLYQNRKPTITLTWPRAPEADEYQLTMADARGNTRRVTSAKPSYAIGSGKLREGSYRFQFRVPGGESSKETRLILDFDNAAPVAQLDEVSFGAGGVRVRGLATVGSEVYVNGRELPLDSHQRFSARVAMPKGQRAIAVKIVRPGGAVHYYVRRASGK